MWRPRCSSPRSCAGSAITAGAWWPRSPWACRSRPSWSSKSGSSCLCRRVRSKPFSDFDRRPTDRNAFASRDRLDGRDRQPVSRLCRCYRAVQPPGDAGRHHAGGDHWRAARPRRRQRRGDPAAADVLDVADLGDHHAVLHLLGRAVRRRDHLGAVQHSWRAVVGRDDVRRLSYGQQGRAGEALTAAFTSSFVGALVAVLVFTFLAPVVAKFALPFGPPEFFSVYFLTFCSFVGIGKGNPFKSIAAMMLGFAMAAVGIDIVTGQLRLTFGFTELLSGFHFLVAVIGLFGIGEILLSMEEGLSFSGHTAKINPTIVLETWKKLPRYWATSRSEE